jgi:hypothetical protein
MQRSGTGIAGKNLINKSDTGDRAAVKVQHVAESSASMEDYM